MSRIGVSLALFSLVAGLAFCAEPNSGLSQDQVQDLVKSVPLDARTTTAMNAVSNNDIKDLALNREITMTNDDVFSFKLPTKGITDQENSGRCWLFAGMNLLRQKVIKKYNLDEFELSQSYLAFWDKIEKANVFLEFIIDTRNRDLLDREVDKMLEEPVGDGGYWEYVINLIQKYGVIPKQFMEESHSSSSTDRMTGILTKLLVRDASILRGLAAQGKSVADLRNEKINMLKDVTRVLVINYGVPPTTFEWRTTDDSTHKVSDPVTYTPQEFYKQVIGVDLSDYVCVGNYPDHPYGKNYSIALTRSMADKPDVSYINVDGKAMKDLALKALLDSNRVWFGCDMGPDVNGKKGLMISNLYNYEDLFGVKLDIPKKDRLDYRISSNNHAMVLVGVDIVDGKPRKWRVENSWGKDRGDDGYFTMSDEWFDQYVLNVVVPRSYLSADQLAMTRQKPTPLPVWDPSWRSLQW
jgi:bleomycin hydrolase